MFGATLLCLCVLISNSHLNAQENGITKNNADNLSDINQSFVSNDHQSRDDSVSFQAGTDHYADMINKLSGPSIIRSTLQVVDDFWDKPLLVRHNNESLVEWLPYIFTAKLVSFFYVPVLFYENSSDVLKSTVVQDIDANICIDQLTHLNERAEVAAKEQFSSKDLNLLQILDTYGQPRAGMMRGDLFWPGLDSECLQLGIRMPDGQSQPTRHCLAMLSPKTKPINISAPYADMVIFRSGVCIPRACDTLKARNKFQLIANLIEFNLGSLEKNQLEIIDLYCPPDEGSPLLSWWRSPATMATLAGFGLWFCVVIYATVRYGSSLSAANWSGAVKKNTDNQRSGNLSKTLKAFSLTRNFEDLAGFTYAKPGDVDERYQITNFDCLESIKVIFMVIAIKIHAILGLGVLVADFASHEHYLDLSAMFLVDGFFAITGLLTAYLVFKQSERSNLMNSPSKWVAFVSLRYIRIMPLYVIVTLYCKYVMKYTGSGPLWDYGTASHLPRYICENESWLWTLLFGSNFKMLTQHCVATGWYLANDFQFTLVTPIFLIALYKNPRLGKLLLGACIFAGVSAGFANVIYVTDDVRPATNYRPHAIKLSQTLNSSYTQPQYRIPAYLCGLVFGYVLYNYEKAKVEYIDTKLALKARGRDSSSLVEPSWPEAFRVHGIWTSLAALSVTFLLPYISPRLPLNKFWSKLGVALFTPIYHVVFASATCSFILLASTGHGNKLLSACLTASFWRPLAKLSLCAMLVNIEVASYMTQTYREQILLDYFTLTSFCLLAIVSVYLVSTILYLLFEAPMKRLVKQILARASSSSDG